MKYTIDNHEHEYETRPQDIGETCKHCWLLRSTIESVQQEKVYTCPSSILEAYPKDTPHLTTCPVIRTPRPEVSTWEEELRDILYAHAYQGDMEEIKQLIRELLEEEG